MKFALQLCLHGADHGYALLGDFLVALLGAQQGFPDAADVGAAGLTENLLDHGIHIALAGAELIDDMAAGVLNFPALSDLALLVQPVNGQVQLRHQGVGATDAAGGPGGENSENLLQKSKVLFRKGVGNALAAPPGVFQVLPADLRK